MTPEGAIKKKVKEVLTNRNCWFTMPVKGGYGRNGDPDFIVCLECGKRGLFVAIETKAQGKTPTLLQLKTLGQIRAAMGTALVVDESNVSELDSILNSIVEILK